MITRWEYTVRQQKPFPHENDEMAFLDSMGKVWELVGVRNAYMSTDVIYYFKREIPRGTGR